jgi:rRNA maturation endonuclease Nob1
MAETGPEHAHEHAQGQEEEICSQCGEPGRGHTHDVKAGPVMKGAAIVMAALLLLAAALALVALLLRRRGARLACPGCRRFVSPREGRCPLCGSAMEGAREAPP